GNKWILNIHSGKCFIYVLHQRLCKYSAIIINPLVFHFWKCVFLINFCSIVYMDFYVGCSYQHTKYHKQTKNQWARDDPAFVVICSLLLAVATVAYCAAYDHSAAHAVSVVISVLLFHFLLAGILLATCCWFLTNAYLREEAPNTCVVEQRVEWQVWLYAFDVHCNSFFPMFVMLYVIHYFLSPLLVAHGFIPALLSNLLFMVAASYHHYLNFLGYDGNFVPFFSLGKLYYNEVSSKIDISIVLTVLPFLERTTFFLYPIGIVIILSPILILSGFNPSRYFMNIYFTRTL
ncbi:hypothetical protein Godav_018563, partial [Gossypium davidsonii]|nr:hypothetical protein [Gossypium davidsonii]